MKKEKQEKKGKQMWVENNDNNHYYSDVSVHWSPTVCLEGSTSIKEKKQEAVTLSPITGSGGTCHT